MIIPCYNVSTFVSECVSSVLAQTYQDIEIICVDDGSTDDTLDVLQNITAEHEGLIQVLTCENEGAAAARNKGIGSACGEFIQFLDADDLLLPTKLQHQVEILRNAKILPDLIVASCTDMLTDGRRNDLHVNQSDVWIGLISGALGSTSSNLWRTEPLRIVGGWDESLGSSQEYELMFRLLIHGAIVECDPDPLTLHRRRTTGSITSTDPHANTIRFLGVRQRILAHLEENELLTGEREQAIFQTLFRAIRRLHQYDKNCAYELANKLLPKDFIPDVSSSLSHTYRLSYSILGFSTTEKLRARLSK